MHRTSRQAPGGTSAAPRRRPHGPAATAAPGAPGRGALAYPADRLDASAVRSLLTWYARVRRDLPWRRTRDPYAIWISETMLQQTRVETVVPYYARFLAALPTVHALAAAPESEVLRLWSGLGYYRRARMLHAAARRLVRDADGVFPEEPASLRELEGVGAYTAGAVASIAFGRRTPVVDGNVARVFSRLFVIREDVKTPAVVGRLWDLAARLVAEAPGDPGDWNQALMELGATVCTPKAPSCRTCPVREHCGARKVGLVDELPVATRKAAPRLVRRVAVVVTNAEAVLLARRRRDALFGGLWEPPGVAAPRGRASGLDELLRGLGGSPTALRPVGDVDHVLTHRRMRVHVMAGRAGIRRRWIIPSDEYDAIELVPRASLGGRGISTLALKILRLAEVVKGAPRGLGFEAD